jgi:hypothetical protein
MPPGLAKVSRRAATLTPSPKMSPSSTTISPTLMPMRNSMRLSAGTVAFRSAMPACISVAQRSASTTLPNSTSSPSPVVLTSRPLCAAIIGSISSPRMAFSLVRVPPSSAPISREYPATSAAKIAARRRVVVIPPASRPCKARRNRWHPTRCWSSAIAISTIRRPSSSRGLEKNLHRAASGLRQARPRRGPGRR